MNVIYVGLVVNIVLALFKLIGGVLGNAQALFSDGLNSLSDVLISIMMVLALSIATKKPDYDHPYGHEKFEGLAYFLLGIIFSITAGWIFISSITSIVKTVSIGRADIPQTFTIWVALGALIMKLALSFLFRYYGKKHENPTIQADAKNHLLDVYATFASLIGIVLSRWFIYFDAIASIIIGVFILKLAIQVLLESVSYLTDQSPKPEVVSEISTVIKAVEGVLSIDDLKVRKHMTQKYVDVEIGVNASLTLKEAHKIAETVHHRVEDVYPDVIHCMVHVNPNKKNQSI